MKVVGLVGWSGSGKTTLMVKLIPWLRSRGLAISTVKHAHHDFDVDQPGKDSFVHRAAGAQEVLVCSATRYALMHELRGAPEPSLAELLAKLSPCDLVLVEGFKRDELPKIEVHRSAMGKPFLHPADPMIVALASDVAPPPTIIPVIHLDDVEAIARQVLAVADIAMTERQRQAGPADVRHGDG